MRMKPKHEESDLEEARVDKKDVMSDEAGHPDEHPRGGGASC